MGQVTPLAREIVLIHHTDCGMTKTTDDEFAAELEAAGYAIQRSYLSYAFAGVHGVEVAGGHWRGGADPGRDGMALVVWFSQRAPDAA